MTPSTRPTVRRCTLDTGGPDDVFPGALVTWLHVPRGGYGYEYPVDAKVLSHGRLLSRQFRWGQLIAGIEAARAALVVAARAGDLLTGDDRTRLQHASELLGAVEQAAWSIKDRP